MNWFPALSQLSVQSGSDGSDDSGVLSGTTDRAADNSAQIATLQAGLSQSQDDLLSALGQIETLQNSTAFNLTENDKRLLRNDYQVLVVENDDHEQTLAKYGEQISPALHSGFVNRPTALKRVGSDILVMSYYHRPCLFDADSKTVSRQMPTSYQNPTSSNSGIAYSYGGAVDVENNLLAVCSWARHVVRVYALDTGDLLYTVGVPSGAGHVNYGKLYSPAQCMFHPVTGNLVIISYNGYGDDGAGGDCKNHGHISEYNSQTGELIATRQGFLGSGTPSTGYVYRPIDGFIQPDGMMWVSVYGRNQLAKLDTNSLTAEGYWPVVDYIAAPPGESLANPWGICECSDGDIGVVSLSKRKLIKLNPVTKQITQQLLLTDLGLAGDPRRILELEPGVFAISDWAANQVYVVPVSGEVSAQYQTEPLADGWEHDSTDAGFDPETGVLTKSYQAMSNPFPGVVKQCMRRVAA